MSLKKPSSLRNLKTGAELSKGSAPMGKNILLLEIIHSFFTTVSPKGPYCFFTTKIIDEKGVAGYLKQKAVELK